MEKREVLLNFLRMMRCLSYFFQTHSLVCKLNLILSSAEFVNKLKIHSRKINVSVKYLHGYLMSDSCPLQHERDAIKHLGILFTVIPQLIYRQRC